MSEMVERVAHEIALNAKLLNIEEAKSKVISEAFARTAIAAMREPTEAMIAAGTIDHGDADDAIWCWHGMIDAALSPSTSGTETKP